MKTRHPLLTFAASTLLSACTVGPKFQQPQIKVPDSWSGGVGEADTAATLKNWWRSFHDPVLNQLIQQAIDGNQDLQVAAQRIRVAQASIDIAAASGLPQIGIGAAGEARRQTQTLDWPPPSKVYGEYQYYQLGLNASWELDLFGETRRRKESAQAGTAGAIEARRGTLISLTASVAGSYASYRAAQTRLQIAASNLEIARHGLKLATHAYEEGQQSHLEVSQAEAQLHAVETSMPAIQAQADTAMHAIAILLGKAPQEFGAAQLAGGTAIPVAPALPASLPSEVIARRPDIRRAEREYAQSNANVGVATAAMYPHFSIPLTLAPTTSDLGALFKNASLLWRLGLNATQSVYAGGRLSAQVEAAEASKDAALITYQQSVLKAFGEVEDALSNQGAEGLRHDSINAQRAASRQALDEATRRYEQGQTGYLPVLESQRSFQVAQEAAAANALAHCLASISLYKSLGGGWEGVALPEPAKAAVAESRRILAAATR